MERHIYRPEPHLPSSVRIHLCAPLPPSRREGARRTLVPSEPARVAQEHGAEVSVRSPHPG